MNTHAKRLKSGRNKNNRLRNSPMSTPLPLVGYMRVSKADGSQTLDLQQDALDAAGVPERNIYSDTASGKRDDRPGLESCLKALRAGDTLVVWKLDRLGRNLCHLVNVVHDLTERNIGLRCAPNGAITSWVQVPPGQWSVGPVAGGRPGRVTVPVEAPRQRPPWAVERIDGPERL